jgi:hypothetical protein
MRDFRADPVSAGLPLRDIGSVAELANLTASHL